MKTYALNDPFVQRFLTELTTVVLATINPDGSPLATPVLFVQDQSHLAMVSVDDLRKVKNLRRDPRTSIAAESVHPEQSACLMIKGVARFAEAPADRLAIGEAFVAKYGERMRTRWGSTAVPMSRALWRIEPVRITAWGWES